MVLRRWNAGSSLMMLGWEFRFAFSHPPHMLPPCEPCHKDGSHGDFSLPEGEIIEFDPTEMLKHLKFVQKYVAGQNHYLLSLG